MSTTKQSGRGLFFQHDRADRTGVLIVNLGTPKAPDASSLRTYLREFLSDPRVVEAPRWLWWLVLRGVILPFRSSRSAKAYQRVWTEKGSPLADYSARLVQAVAGLMSDAQTVGGDQVVVKLAMRYGEPSISRMMDEMAEQQVRRILVLPLYPQYSATTSASVFDAVTEYCRQRRWIPELRFINEYYADEAWLNAMAGHIQKYRQQLPPAEKLIFSFHGIPRRYFLAGDPYYCQCQATVRLLTERLGMGEDDYLLTFQSRFGREEWLKPYTDHTLQALAGDGIKRVQVVCPGFAVDCLETLDEIALENREIFEHAGGEKLDYIPALNAEEPHARALAALIHRHLSGWPLGIDDTAAEERARQARQVASATTYFLPHE